MKSGNEYLDKFCKDNDLVYKSCQNCESGPDVDECRTGCCCNVLHWLETFSDSSVGIFGGPITEPFLSLESLVGYVQSNEYEVLAQQDFWLTHN